MSGNGQAQDHTAGDCAKNEPQPFEHQRALHDDRLPAADELPVALFLIDARGCIQEVNQAGSLLLKNSKQELLHASFLQFIRDPADKSSFTTHCKTALSTRIHTTLSLSLSRPDGTLLPVHLKSIAAENHDGSAGCIRTVILETYDGQTAAGAGTASTRETSLLVNFPLAFSLCEIVVNDEGEPWDYRYLDVNPAYERLSGAAKEHLLTRTAREFNPEMDPAWLERVGKVALTGEQLQFEHYVPSVDKWLEVHMYSPHPRRFASIIRDVTGARGGQERPQAGASWNPVLLEQLPHSVFLKDTDSVYLFGNQLFAQGLGVVQEDIPGKTDYDLFPAELARKYREDDRKLLEQGRVLSREEQYHSSDGVRWVSTVKAPISNGNGSPVTILGIFSDITDRKSAEEAMLQSRELYRSLAEAGPALVWSTDAEGRPDYVNSLWQSYTGLALEQLRGCEQVCHVDDLEPFLQLGIRAASEGAPVDGEFRFRRADGVYRWFWTSVVVVKDRSGRVIKRVGTAVDMTERKQAEDALELNQELLREYVRLLEYAPVMVRTMNDEILLWNKGMEKIYGYTAVQAIGKNSHTFLKTHLSESRDAIRLKLERAGRWEGEVSHRAADGREIIVNSLWIVHQNLQGQATAIIEVNSDITERRRAEEGLRLAHAELERRTADIEAVNRELDAFSYSVSHDLKAPLCNIEGFTRALLEDYAEKLDSTGKDYVKRLNSASLRMKQLIEALLNMARVTTGEVRERIVDLSALVRVIIQDLSHQDPHRQVEVRIAGNLSAQGNQAMLQVMLQNLLSNSWKFTGKRVQAVIEFGVIEQDSRSIFFVRDNGAGFSMEYAEMLFMPFKRFHGKDEFPGIGIGLATAHRIISRHNGRIWAESAPDQGATFYFTLP